MTKFIAAAILTIAAGCAAGPIEPSERLDRDYRTGSNIPQRGRTGDDPGMTTLNRETLQRERDLSPPPPTPLPPQPAGAPRGG